MLFISLYVRKINFFTIFCQSSGYGCELCTIYFTASALLWYAEFELLSLHQLLPWLHCYTQKLEVLCGFSGDYKMVENTEILIMQLFYNDFVNLVLLYYLLNHFTLLVYKSIWKFWISTPDFYKPDHYFNKLIVRARNVSTQTRVCTQISEYVSTILI